MDILVRKEDERYWTKLDEEYKNEIPGFDSGRVWNGLTRDNKQYDEYSPVKDDRVSDEIRDNERSGYLTDESEFDKNKDIKPP